MTAEPSSSATTDSHSKTSAPKLGERLQRGLDARITTVAPEVR